VPQGAFGIHVGSGNVQKRRTVALHEINPTDGSTTVLSQCWACCPLVTVQTLTLFGRNFLEQSALSGAVRALSRER
jgi:hypothetical protein